MVEDVGAMQRGLDQWRSSMEDLSVGTIREDCCDGNNDLSSVESKVLFPTPQSAANMRYLCQKNPTSPTGELRHEGNGGAVQKASVAFPRTELD